MLPEYEKRIREVCPSEGFAQQILAIIQEDEEARRAGLVARQSEGLKKARERGIQLGRPPVKRPRKFRRVYEEYRAGVLSARAAAQLLEVSPGTFKRWVTAEEAQNA